MPRLARLVVSACLLPLAGCGTFSDAVCGPIGPGHDQVYYRGVRFDALAASEGGAKVFMIADMPFSAVADTLLIPFLLYSQFKSQQNARPESRVEPGPQSLSSGSPRE